MTRPDASDRDLPERIATVTCTECGHPSRSRRRLALRALAGVSLWPRQPKCFADVSEHLEWLPECPCRNAVHGG